MSACCFDAWFEARGASPSGKNRSMDIGAASARQAPRSIDRSTRRSRTRARPWAALAIALMLVTATARVRADDDSTVAEYRIKAPFLLKFLHLVKSNAAAERQDAPVVIGALG